MIKYFNTLHQRARAGARGRQSKKMIHNNLNTSQISTGTKNNEEKNQKRNINWATLRANG